MKSFQSILVAVIAVPVVLACVGPGRTNKLEAMPSAPAATGDVTTSRGENDNTEVKVEVEHLAPPQEIARGASVYIVWAKPRSQEPPQNLGALTVGDDRKGKLETKTPLKQFDVVVTPESSATAAEPTGDPVMRASVNAR
jgi:hypothetical protein